MNKYQTLAANTALISIGTFGLKVLVFLNPSHCKSIPPASKKQRLSALLFCACGSKSPYGIIRKQTIERRGTDGYRANETILSRA